MHDDIPKEKNGNSSHTYGKVLYMTSFFPCLVLIRPVNTVLCHKITIIINFEYR